MVALYERKKGTQRQDEKISGGREKNNIIMNKINFLMKIKVE